MYVIGSSIIILPSQTETEHALAQFTLVQLNGNSHWFPAFSPFYFTSYYQSSLPMEII